MKTLDADVTAREQAAAAPVPAPDPLTEISSNLSKLLRQADIEVAKLNSVRAWKPA